MFSQTQINNCQKNWNQKKAMTLSTTFVGRIQLDESEQSCLTKLKRATENDVLNQAKETLLREIGDESISSSDSLEPNDSDFVFATFRALSATILSDRPIDFTNEKILKASTTKLVGQTVFKDHETYVDNWVGKVDSTVWDNKTEGLPPGINAVLKLDSIKDPMTVRGVLQGAIHSASVTVSFEWQPSHPSLMNDGSFFDHLGEEIEDEMVRIIVTKIDRFWEISLVWQGADEFAKQIGSDGKPVHQSAHIPTKLHLQSLSNTTNQENQMNELQDILDKTLGEKITKDNFKAAFKSKLEDETQTLKDSHQAEIESLNAKIDDLKLKNESLIGLADLGKSYLSDQRQETIRLYKLAKSDNVSAVILSTLEKTDLETIQAFQNEFKLEVEEKFPASCAECGSKKISRRSSRESVNQDKAIEAKKLSPDAEKRIKELHTI